MILNTLIVILFLNINILQLAMVNLA